MARQRRKLSNTGIYHIVLRGNERKNIFLNNGEKARFLGGIDAKSEETDFTVYAYCLMDNHVHLIVNTQGQELASIMKGIAVRYATFYNWKYSRVGHVFQDRFKSEPIENDRYLLTAVRYVHNNPVKAKLVERPCDYQWSSFTEYFYPTGRVWLDTRFVLSIIDDDRNVALQQFEQLSLQEDDTRFIDIEYEQVRTIEEGKAYLTEYLRDQYQGISIERINKDTPKRTQIIKHLRLNTRLSQRVIAALLGVDKSVVEKAKQD